MNSIIFVMNRESADDVQKFWGDQFPMMCVEEVAEFQQAVSKLERYSNQPERKENLKEEIRDVIICIAGLMARYDISDSEINKLIVNKLKEDK